MAEVELIRGVLYQEVRLLDEFADVDLFSKGMVVLDELCYLPSVRDRRNDIRFIIFNAADSRTVLVHLGHVFSLKLIELRL